MKPHRTLSLIGAAIALTIATSGLALATAQEPEIPDEPAVAQICAATSVEKVDQILNDIASSELIEALDGLVTIGVPDSEDPTVNVSGQLADVKTRLNCDALTSPSASPDPTPPLYADCAAVIAAGEAPLLSTEPGFRPELDSDGDGIACEDVVDENPDDQIDGPTPDVSSGIGTGDGSTEA